MTKNIISTKKQQQKDFTSRTKMERKILMGGAGLALLRTLISLMNKPGLGGLNNLDMIDIMDPLPRYIRGMT